MSTEGPQASADNLKLRAIYLNDHFAGATAGVELARRLAGAQRETPSYDTIKRIEVEIAEDRETLRKIMSELDVSITQYKPAATWLGEKIGRLKLNGRLLGRSPLSTLIELELLRLGVEGKAAAWRTLRAMNDEGRLDKAELDGLLRRAQAQIDTLEQLRVEAAAEALG